MFLTITNLFILVTSDTFCHCGSCGHETINECYTKQCPCCLSDHQGPFGKNR